MTRVSSRAAATGLVLAVGLGAAGCERIQMLQANIAFKDANKLYAAQNYGAAAEKYQEAIDECRGESPDCTHEALDAAYFFLGNSYDNQWRPARRGDPANDALMDRAIQNYTKAAEVEEDPIIKQRAMEYLVQAYSPERLNDPAAAEPVLRRMIQIDPTEPTNYTYLAKIYEDNGLYEEAEQLLMTARDQRPNDGGVYVTLAAYYKRQGEFDKAMGALHARAEREATNPEAFYTLANYYWDGAYNDFAATDAQKLERTMAGLEAADRALVLNPTYVDAIIFKGLLLRVQARLEKDQGVVKELLAEADALQQQAIDLSAQQGTAPQIPTTTEG
jgi:predicted Zn-dependent protease